MRVFRCRAGNGGHRSALTDAVVVLHLVARGADAAEGALQVLAGARGAGPGQAHALVDVCRGGKQPGLGLGSAPSTCGCSRPCLAPKGDSEQGRHFQDGPQGIPGTTLGRGQDFSPAACRCQNTERTGLEGDGGREGPVRLSRGISGTRLCFQGLVGASGESMPLLGAAWGPHGQRQPGQCTRDTAGDTEDTERTLLGH